MITFVLYTAALAPQGKITRCNLLGSTITFVIWLCNECHFELKVSKHSNKSASHWSRPLAASKIIFVSEVKFGLDMKKRGSGKHEDPRP